MIKVTGKTLRKVKDVGQGLARVEPAEVAAALGAEPVAEGTTRPQSPLGLFALRQGLAERLRSTGGRPGLGELRRQKIPMSDADWEILVKLAEAVADEEIHPTPGQLASEILHRQLTELRDQLRRGDQGKEELSTVARRLSAPNARLHAGLGQLDEGGSKLVQVGTLRFQGASARFPRRPSPVTQKRGILGALRWA